MKNKKKTTIIIVATGIILVITGFIVYYTCYHRWDDATCTKPKTCSICGKTEGEALGHQWMDATCTEPQICSVCKETKGKALGHKADTWSTIKEATCTEAGEKEATCKRCGKSLVEEIPMMEHTPGEWKIIKDYKINRDGTVTPGTQAIQCTVCNKELETKEYTIELTNSQKNAIIRAYEEENSWHVSRDYLINDILVGFDYFNVEDATFAVDHMAEGNYKKYLRTEMVKAKKYFYVLRPLLAGQWILEKESPPPMLFSELVEVELPDEVRTEVEDLLKIKIHEPEIKKIPRVNRLNEYLESEIAGLREKAGKLREEKKVSWEKLNEIFLKEV